MQRYRERIPELLAWRFDPDVPLSARPEWVQKAFADVRVTIRESKMLRIGAADFGRPGDWLVSRNNALHFCTHDLFNEAYEPVES